MKHLFFTFTCIAVILSSCSESQPIRTDREKDNLKGNVKSVMTIEFNAFDKFNEGVICKGAPDNYCKLIEFDSLGFYQHIIRYDLKLVDGKTISYFDEHNRKMRQETYRDISNTNASKCEIYKYDSHNNVIEIKDPYDNRIEKSSFQYDNDGNVIWEKHKYDDIRYVYKDGKLISKKQINTVFDSPDIYYTTYEYDEKGNLTKYITTFGQGLKTYNFTTYDQFNREIDFYYGEVDNPTVSQMRHRVKWFYENDYVTKPYLSQYFDKEGNLYMENRTVWFTNAGDTTCILEFRKNLINELFDIHMDNKAKIEIYYKISSKIGFEEHYQYDDNHQLISTSNSLGTFEEYKYQNGELYEKVDHIGDSRRVFSYDNNLLKSCISYNSKDSIDGSTAYDYKKDGDLYIETITSKFSNGSSYKDEKTYRNNLLIKLVSYEEGEVIGKCECLYNVNNDIIRSIDITNGLQTESNYTYEYDSTGNWIRKITYINGKVDSIIERAITYYK